MERGERLGKVLAPEIGPQSLGEIELGVGAFPKQEIRQPSLAAGADDEVDVARLVLAGQKSRKAAAGEILRAGGPRGRPQDRVARRIIERNAKMQPGAAGRLRLGALDLRREPARKAVPASDHSKACAAPHEPRRLGSDVASHQPHQGRDLGRRPAPVVDGEGIEGKRADALVRRCFRDAPNGLDAGFVPAASRHSPRRGPAPVAIHDDADVKFRGESAVHCCVPLQGEFCVRRGGR